MFDSLYENIGGKIKIWAKWIFVGEAICAIIAGLVLACTDDDLIIFGLLISLGCPFLAYIGSWILYAFGELVEKTCDNESNTRKILKKLKENTTNEAVKEYQHMLKTTSEAATSKPAETPTENKEVWTTVANFSTTKSNTIICSQCKFEQPGNRKICWNCGAKFEDETITTTSERSTHKWLCNGCKKMRTQTPCEYCGKE